MPCAAWRSFATHCLGPLGETLKREWNDKDWFDKNKPGCVSAALDYFRAQIEAQKADLCAGRGLKTISDFTIQNSCEGDYGDPNQTLCEQVLFLGAFDFRLERFTYIRGSCHIRYTAEIIIVDRYGTQKNWCEFGGDDPPSLNTPPEICAYCVFYLAFGAERQVTLARYIIGDILLCFDDDD